MQLHELKSVHRTKKRKRVGRGGKRGTYSGRGVKGLKARAGRKMPPIIREIIKRYPKLKGYRHKNIAKNLVAVNIGILEKKFEPGETVNPQSLLKKGIISRIKGKVPVVKILSKGELKKDIIVENCRVSKEAKAKIGKANGTVK